MDGDIDGQRLNSVKYWDQRFLEDWVAMGGRRQTAFFATMVARCLPRLVTEDIAAERLSVFDYGCALGDALPMLQPTFPKSVLSGGDVSSVAIALARTLHPRFDFVVLDQDRLQETLADVVYCSNTLEHFADWREKLDALAAAAAQYVIVAVPYCERELISEHAVTFESGTFPEALNNAARLVCLEVMDTAGEPGSMWPGRQIIVIYAHPPAFDRLIRRGWIAERERGAVETSTALSSRAAEDAAKLATVNERQAASEAMVADLNRRLAEAGRVAKDRQTDLEAQIADYARRLQELERLAAATEASLQAAIAEQANRLIDEGRAAAKREGELAGNIAEAERRLAEAEHRATERESLLKAAVSDHAEKLLAAGRAAAEREAALAAESDASAQQLVQSEALLAQREASHQARITELDQRLTENDRVRTEHEASYEARVAEFADRLAESDRVRAEREASYAARIGETAERLAQQARQAAARETGLESQRRQLEVELASTRAQLDRRKGRRTRRIEARAARRIAAAVTTGDRANAARNWSLASRYYRTAVALEPGLMPIWVQLGHALKEQGDYGGAEAAYHRALTLDPAVADTHLQLGHLLKVQNRTEDAAVAYAAAVALDPDAIDATRELDLLVPNLIAAGDAARDARDWRRAAECYRRALDRAPQSMSIWVQLGHALKEQGDYPGAEAAYRRALALNGAVPDTHLQLGHLMNLQARRAQAVEAYAAALRLDPDLLPARESLHALVGYSPSEIGRALSSNGNNAPVKPDRSPPAVVEVLTPEPLTPADRYGEWFADAIRKRGDGHDVIWLGVIDWHFRIQRPQHLATHLADLGHRVFYLSILFEAADEKGRFRIIDSPHQGVFEVRARLYANPAETIYQGLSAPAVTELQLVLDELVGVLDVHAPIVVVEHPAWHPVACAVPGATVIYDCLDLATGFSNVAKPIVDLEDALIADADLVITASRPLADLLASQRACPIIRNAADFDFFAQASSDRPPSNRPVIGYFGAIADWFNIEWIESCAVAYPNWEFRLIGRTDGCDINRAKELPNVHFLGEQQYQDLPRYLEAFDAAIIPFKMVDLIKCTNPVKLYEYMSAGKTVVAAPMPEVLEATDLVYIADDGVSFAQRIAQALAEDGSALRHRRQAWAREHTWANRARQFVNEIEASLPLVSVIVLTHNQWEFTKACLFSIRNWSDYPNLEIIVVDNASTDATPQKLLELEQLDSRVRVILNEANLGFSAGNNVGLRAARGEYLILINNDTFVTRGWVRDLIRPLQRDPKIGLVGPLTNNIGNEQKVRLIYNSMTEMEKVARRFTRSRLRRTYPVKNLAFFCVAIQRALLDEVGFLDEVYGLGFYEDDDYCKQVTNKGYGIVIADDVFVHHHLAVSFQALGAKAGEQMARNRAIFEERWGPWQPHRYRDEPGFG